MHDMRLIWQRNCHCVPVRAYCHASKRCSQMLAHLLCFNPESQDRISVLQRLYLRISVVFLTPYRQGVLRLFAGAPLNEIYQFRCTTFFFVSVKKKKRLAQERLLDSTDELNNADSSTVYWRMYSFYPETVICYRRFETTFRSHIQGSSRLLWPYSPVVLPLASKTRHRQPMSVL